MEKVFFVTIGEKTLMNDKISIFGGTGFILSNFARLYPEISCIEPRESNESKNSDILYGISTTTNYSVFDNPYIDINTNLTKLMQIVDNLSPENTINFISSWFVYDQSDKPIDENYYCNPRGFYSITKRAAEQLLISYCKTYNIKYRILRLANVIGNNDNFSAQKNGLQFLIEKLKKNDKVELYNDGDWHRNYIYNDEVCRAIKFVIDNGEFNSIYNIGHYKNHKFNYLINYCRIKLNSKSLITSRPPSDLHKICQVESFQMNVDKLKNLGFKWDLTIEESLDKIL